MFSYVLSVYSVFYYLGDANEIEKFLKQQVKKPARNIPSFFAKKATSSTSSTQPEQKIKDDCAVAGTSSNRKDEYSFGNKSPHLHLFLRGLTLTEEEISNLLTEDVKSSKVIMNALISVSVVHLEYRKVRDLYMAKGLKFRHESKLKSSITEVSNAEHSLYKSLQELGSIKINSSLGLDLLTVNVNKKKSIQSISVIKASKLRTLLSNRKLIHDLNRRVTQQCQREDFEFTDQEMDKVKFYCINDMNLSWPDALDKILDKQNSCIDIIGPLSESDLISIGSLLEDCTAVPVNLLQEQYSVAKGKKNELVKQLLLYFPVLLLDFGFPLIVNLWQSDFTDPEFEDYAMCTKDKQENVIKETGEQTDVIVSISSMLMYYM